MSAISFFVRCRYAATIGRLKFLMNTVCSFRKDLEQLRELCLERFLLSTRWNLRFLLLGASQAPSVHRMLEYRRADLRMQSTMWSSESRNDPWTIILAAMIAWRSVYKINKVRFSVVCYSGLARRIIKRRTSRFGYRSISGRRKSRFFSLSELGLGWSRDFENCFSLIQMRTTHSSRLVYVSYEVLCGIYLTNNWASVDENFHKSIPASDD